MPPPEKAADIESELWRQHSLSTDLGTSCVALSEPCQLFDRASSSKNKSLSCSQLLQVSHCQLLNMKHEKLKLLKDKLINGPIVLIDWGMTIF